MFYPSISFIVSLAILVSSFVLSGCSDTELETRVLYEASSGPAKGWSHIVTSPDSFPLLALDNAKYAVDERSLEAEESIEGGSVFRTVLVRKLSNWGQQHALSLIHI